MSQYLGDISAYALAVSQGYTGTEEEYAELMASYATVGQTAVTAAQTATTKASEAATSATTATNKASEATTAAQTATTKAAEASTSASTAVSAKDTAVSASQTATTKATEATTAAATATSAKTDAVAANTAAQSAKTAAQTAQTGAETAAASVQSSAAQIATNADDIAQLKSEITALAPKEDAYKAFPTDTASGAVASFADGANVPVKSLIVNIDTVQEGSGDPSPDNVRPISGWSEVNVQRTGKNLLTKSAGNTGTIIRSGITFTFEDDGSVTLNGTASESIWPVLWGSRGLTVQNNSSWDGLSYAYKLPAGTYTYSVTTSGTATTTPIVRMTAYLNDGTAKIYTTGSTFSTVAGLNSVFISEITSGVEFTNYNIKWQLELGSTATPYEPYSGQSITIELGQTVYGGKLDVTNGVLTVDRSMGDLGTLTWTYNSTNEAFFTWGITDIIKTANTLLPSNIICSKYITLGSNYVYSATGTDKSIALLNGGAVIVKDMAYTDETAFKTAMSGVQLVYELATPITVQLTPHEVTALLGFNNIWADSGDSEVTYRADTKLYIQKKIAEAISALS